MSHERVVGDLSPALEVAWSRDVFREGLQLIADGVTELLGFGVACISLVRGNALEVIAVSADDTIRAELFGTSTSVSSLMDELAKAEEWGRLVRFLPHELLGEGLQASGWVPDFEPLDLPDAWHPLDMLIAPLYSTDGTELLGTMSIDLPHDGRRPRAEQRRMLDKYAEQAGRAVVTVLERERLAEQMRLATTARSIVRDASAQPSMDALMDGVPDALLEGFAADGMWIEIFDEAGESHAIFASGERVFELPHELARVAESTAHRYWKLQRANVVSPGAPRPGSLSEREYEAIRRFQDAHGIASTLFAPLGSGPVCVGNLVLTRRADQPDWSQVEIAAALDLGHDLGQAIFNARTYEQEHDLVTELRALDTYKSQLIATICHELKNPLTALIGHLELLEGAEPDDGYSRTSLAAMQRSSGRMSRLVENLLTLSRVGDPSIEPRRDPVDVGLLVDDVLDLVRTLAERKRQSISVHKGPEPVLALGDAGELDRVVANLLSNAVKYTPDGGRIRVSVHAEDDAVVLSCADEGLGISEEDQARLFDEFFRSPNPDASAQPGTGLGLAIVKRIVDRHRGRISVTSALGVGTTFTVRLPVATRTDRPDEESQAS